ncbi:MAG: protein kinase domain-containing protein, partial [Lysobacterales bacterium]
MTTPPTSASPAEAIAGCWRFGAWQLCEADQRLQTDTAEAIELDRSAYGMLRYLLLHAGEVCTTEELLAAGWPGRVVSPNSVTKCVSRLRRTLGDADAEVIRLVHGYGYRLVSDVRYLTGEATDRSTASGSGLTPGDSVPHRPDWTLQQRLGRGGCGEVLSASAEGEAGMRAYKFALGEDGLRALKREVALHRLLQEQPRVPASVLPLLDWNLEAPPFFVATPWMEAGNLSAWAECDARLSTSSRTQRLEWSARLCESVEALHAADIAHRDLKPENIYPVEKSDGGLHFLLGDLGAGAGLLPPGIDALGLPIGQATRLGRSDPEDPASPGHRYIAPEVLAGHAAGHRADVFALGVLCAQLVAGDLRMSMAPGWEERIGDPLLSADLAEAAHIDPKRRLGSAGELAERLRSLETRREAARQRLREAEELAGAEARVQRLRRRWRVASAIAGSALLALSV